MFANDLLNKKTERFKLEDNQEVFSNKKKVNGLGCYFLKGVIMTVR
jgi:hypothetical protein